MNELALFAGAGGGILGGKLLGWRTVGCGSTVAYELCEAFEMDPEEEVSGAYCDACEP